MGRKSVVTLAREFAVEAHGSQRYGDNPYSFHLDEVAILVQPYGEQHQAVAYLHDVVEDTDVGIEQVSAEFGELVARCVALLTDEPGENRKERKRLTYARLQQVPAESDEAMALVVKAADRLANLRNCVLNEKKGLMRMYRKEHRDFREALYRPGLAEEFWTELEELIAVKR